MCINIHADGHLCIKLLYEQNLPQLKDNTIQFRECYDVILRNFSKKEISRLYLLSPHFGFNNAEVKPLVRYPDCENFDWIFLSKKKSGQDIFHLEFPSSKAVDSPLQYDATWLEPQLKVPEFLRKGTDARSIVDITNMTIIEVDFKYNKKIEPYDPKRDSETTYWLRLCYDPRINFVIESPLKFGKDREMNISVLPCVGLGPQTIINGLDNTLNMLTANNKVKEYIPTAKKILMEDLFGKENTSTIIQDYIINIITTEEFLFLNPHVDGPCGFVGHVPVPGINAIARTWFTGSNNYRETSPIEIARQVYSYLQEYAHNREDAKSKERIDSAISSDIYSNVCHVTDALVQEGIVFEREDRPGYYYTEENENHAETLKDPDVLEVSRADYDRLRDRYLCLLDRLFSRLKLHHQDKYSFFKPKGFRLQYELAYI